MLLGKRELTDKLIIVYGQHDPLGHLTKEFAKLVSHKKINSHPDLAEVHLINLRHDYADAEEVDKLIAKFNAGDYRHRIGNVFEKLRNMGSIKVMGFEINLKEILGLKQFKPYNPVEKYPSNRPENDPCWSVIPLWERE